MSAYFKRATAATYVIFLVDSSNRPVGKTGASPSLSISQDGGAFAVAAGSVAEIGSGYYKIGLAASELDARVVAIKATASGADPWNDIFLTDTVIVSEISSDVLALPIAVGGGSVWTEAEKQRALREIRETLEAVQGLPAQLAALQATIDVRADGLQASSRALGEQAEAVRRQTQESIAGIVTLVEQSARSLPEQFREGFQEHKASIVTRLIQTELVLMGRVQALQEGSTSMDDGLGRLRKDVEYLVRAITRSMNTETLEHMAAEAVT